MAFVATARRVRCSKRARAGLARKGWQVKRELLQHFTVRNVLWQCHQAKALGDTVHIWFHK